MADEWKKIGVLCSSQCYTEVEIYLREGVHDLIIVLDTNIFCRDFYARGTQMQLLLKMGNIIVPEIVFDETLNKHSEKIREAGSMVQKKVEEYNRLAYDQIKIDFEEKYVDEDMRYETFLTDLLLAHGGYPPESYPNVEHKIIVARALARKKPFKPDGREGYRDYLVWRTVLEIVKHYTEPIHFVSENPKDFADERDKKKLHPDLLEEMKQLQLDATKLIYWSSLKGFIDEVVKPELQKAEDEEKLKQNLLENAQFTDAVSNYLDNHLKGFDVKGYDIFVPGVDPTIEEFEEGFDKEITDISKVECEKLLITMLCKCDSIVTSILTKLDAASLPQEYLENSSIAEISDRLFKVSTEVPIDIVLEIIYDTRTGNVETIEITDISDSNYCEYCLYE